MARFSFVVSQHGGEMRSLIFLMLFSAASAHGAEPAQNPYRPKNGYISNEKTAIAVAVAAWKPIYGAEQIDIEKPYVAALKNGIWHLSGSLPKGWVGGVAEAEISKADGTILRVFHGK